MDSGRWEEVRAAAVRMEELRLGDPEGWLLLRELVERLTEQEESARTIIVIGFAQNLPVREKREDHVLYGRSSLC